MKRRTLIKTLSFILLAISCNCKAQFSPVDSKQVDTALLHWTGKVNKGYRHGNWLGLDSNNIVRIKARYEVGKLNGLWEEFYNDTTLREKGTYKNDERVGMWVTYYRSGQLMIQQQYANGQREGLFKEWYNVGCLKDSGWCKNDEREGLWYHFSNCSRDPKGVSETRIETNYLNGKKNGKERVYRNNRLVEENNYILNKQTGEQMEFWPSGKLQSTRYRKDGLLDSLFTSYWETGGVKETGMYRGGKMVGVWKVFDPVTHQLVREEYYGINPVVDSQRLARFHMLWTVMEDRFQFQQPDSAHYYDHNNILKAVWLYNDSQQSVGRGSARVVTYYDGDRQQVSSMGPVIADRKNGVWVTYDRKGIVTSRINFVGGKPDGVCTWYYNNGAIRGHDPRASYGYLSYQLKVFDRAGSLLVQSNIDHQKQLDTLYLITPELFIPIPKMPVEIQGNDFFETETIEEVQHPSEPDSIAQFIGGTEGLNLYLKTNMVYPPEERMRGLTASITITFTVAIDGSIQNPRTTATKGYTPAFEREALRLITAMPKWKPATTQGKAVASETSVTVSFK